jgi:L-histidine Nalpha-methyltransferase
MNDCLDGGVTVPPFFETEDHRAAVIRGVLNHELPLKYAYAGSAAHTHDLLAHEEGYQSVIGTVAHELAAIHTAGKRSRLHHIAEIGPGNGSHTLALLGELQTTGTLPLSYLALDFSRTLLALMLGRAARELPDLPTDSQVWDIEEGPTKLIHQWRPDQGSISVLFLGNTVGNLKDPVGALRHLHDSVRAGDTLVVGATLQGPEADTDKMVQPYLTAAFRAAALQPLIQAGIPADALDFWPFYRDGAVFGEAVLTRPVTVDGHPLNQGHSVRCFMSRRFTDDNLSQMVREAGWHIVHTGIDLSADHIIIVAEG